MPVFRVSVELPTPFTFFVSARDLDSAREAAKRRGQNQFGFLARALTVAATSKNRSEVLSVDPHFEKKWS